MIKIDNATFTYSGADVPSIKNINLEIKKGEFVLLLGSSGCGKTTVTRLINGLISEYYEGELEGEVIVDGKNTRETYVSELSSSVGSVFQDPSSQFFTTDSTSELMFSCENQAMPREEMLVRYEEIVRKFKLEKLIDRKVFRLSSGEKQLIAIGSVCAYSPTVLVFDEPSANLDGKATARLYEALAQLKSEGYTIVVAEHKIHYIADLADRAIIFRSGEIHRELTGSELCSLSNEEANHLGLRGINLAEIKPKQRAKKYVKPSLEINDLEFYFSRKSNVIKNLSVKFHSGEVVALVGKNGRGKTTLMEIICGLRKEKNGEFILDRRKMKKKNRQESSYLVMQTSDYQLFSDSVESELYTGNEQIKSNSKCKEILERLHLDNLEKRHPFSLSGGQKQRLCIAVALLRDVSVVCLDEPTSGLDYNNMCVVSDCLRELASSERTVIVATHDYEFLIKSCDKIIHLTDSYEVEVISVEDGTLKKIYSLLNE